MSVCSSSPEHWTIWSWISVCLEIAFPGMDVISAPSVEFLGSGSESLRAWYSQPLCWGGGRLYRKDQGICISVQCEVHFLLPFWAGSDSFCQKSLKIHPITIACRRLMILQRQHSWQSERRFPQRDLKKPLADTEFGDQREVEKGSTASSGFRMPCGMVAKPPLKSTGKASGLKWCTWGLCSLRCQNIGSKEWWLFHVTLCHMRTAWATLIRVQVHPILLL